MIHRRPPSESLSASIIQMPVETRTVIDNVRWETYAALGDDRAGTLMRIVDEVGWLHERAKRSELEMIRNFRNVLPT